MLDGFRGTYDGHGTSTDIDSFLGALGGIWGSSLGHCSDFPVGYADHSMDSSGVLGGVLGGLATAFQDATRHGGSIGLNDSFQQNPRTSDSNAALPRTAAF